MDLQGLGQPEEEITEELTLAQKRAKKLVDRSRKDSAIDDDYLAVGSRCALEAAGSQAAVYIVPRPVPCPPVR